MSIDNCKVCGYPVDTDEDECYINGVCYCREHIQDFHPEDIDERITRTNEN